MADDLPPYSGEPTRCPKCGHSDATTLHSPEKALCNGDGWDDERLCRKCQRCGYHWDEAIVGPDTDPDRDGPKPAIVGRILSSADEEPPAGTVVRCLGRPWGNLGEYWVALESTSDPETWNKVAGNYGPVTVLKWGGDRA